jgi:integrase
MREQAQRELRKAWITACKKALLVGMIPHDLRRTAVWNLERAGVSRSVAMKLTGHKTDAVYRRYAIVSDYDMREGAAKLAILHGDTPDSRHIDAHERVFGA